jgi:hypothetical protein
MLKRSGKLPTNGVEDEIASAAEGTNGGKLQNRVWSTQLSSAGPPLHQQSHRPGGEQRFVGAQDQLQSGVGRESL